METTRKVTASHLRAKGFSLRPPIFAAPSPGEYREHGTAVCSETEGCRPRLANESNHCGGQRSRAIG